MRRSANGAALVVLASAACIGVAQAGGSAIVAGCGGVQQATARHWRGSLPPLTIGDSTMLLALPDLSREGFDVNARGCRQYPEAIGLITSLARARRLPHLVVIALGANGQIEPGNVEQALRILGPGRVLVLLTPRELGGGSGSDAHLVRDEGRRHGGRLVVLDWVAYSSSHPGWFEPDGLHVNPTGAGGLAQLIGRVLPIAAPQRSARIPRCLPPQPPAPSAGKVPPAKATEPAQTTSSPAPAGVLHGVTVHSHGRVLRASRRRGRLDVPVLNSNPFAVGGLARVELADGTGPKLLAAACISVAPAGLSDLAIKLSGETLGDAELLARFKVRLVLTLYSAEGLHGTSAGTYVLRATAH